MFLCDTWGKVFAGRIPVMARIARDQHHQRALIARDQHHQMARIARDQHHQRARLGRDQHRQNAHVQLPAFFNRLLSCGDQHGHGGGRLEGCRKILFDEGVEGRCLEDVGIQMGV